MSSDFAGKPIECKAAVCYAANEPLKIETVSVMPPQAGEVRVKINHTALCHTDLHAMSGVDSEIDFSTCSYVFGHESAGVVESVGEGVTDIKAGDTVIVNYTPECGSCKYCASPKTNLCNKIRSTQGQGLLPSGQTCFNNVEGKKLHSFMGVSGFAQYSTVAAISCCKVDETKYSTDKVCLMGCGVTTGVGAVLKTAKVEEGSTCAVIGLGAVGLAAIMGCKLAKAKRIFAIDTNESKKELALKLGATDFVNPTKLDKPVEEYIVELTEGGVDYSFEAVGHIATMKSAVIMSARGWGVCTIAGVAPAGAELALRPFLMITGRTVKGTAFGGVKSRTDLPEFVEMCYDELDDFITGYRPLAEINEGFEDMKKGIAIRTVINMFE